MFIATQNGHFPSHYSMQISSAMIIHYFTVFPSMFYVCIKTLKYFFRRFALKPGSLHTSSPPQRPLHTTARKCTDTIISAGGVRWGHMQCFMYSSRELLYLNEQRARDCSPLEAKADKPQRSVKAAFLAFGLKNVEVLQKQHQQRLPSILSCSRQLCPAARVLPSEIMLTVWATLCDQLGLTANSNWILI